MKFSARFTWGALLLLGAATLFAGPAAAQTAPPATGSEVVSTQINVRTPSGIPIVGTLVAHRQCGDPTLTDLSFTGMINGAPAHAEASAVEHWVGNSQADVTITEITNWDATVGQPHPMTLSIRQVAPGLVTVNGVPVAINGLLQAPCSGRTTYSISNGGVGEIIINRLPYTGTGPFALDPLVVVALLIGPGLVLALVAGWFERRGAGRVAGPGLG